MKTGDRLPNGAIVLECTDGIVLAKGEKGVVVAPKGEQPQYVEYITWRWDGKDPSTTVWGHYWKSLANAAKDYETRVAKDQAGRYANG